MTCKLIKIVNELVFLEPENPEVVINVFPKINNSNRKAMNSHPFLWRYMQRVYIYEEEFDDIDSALSSIDFKDKIFRAQVYPRTNEMVTFTWNHSPSTAYLRQVRRTLLC